MLQGFQGQGKQGQPEPCLPQAVKQWVNSPNPDVEGKIRRLRTCPMTKRNSANPGSRFLFRHVAFLGANVIFKSYSAFI